MSKQRKIVRWLLLVVIGVGSALFFLLDNSSARRLGSHDSAIENVAFIRNGRLLVSASPGTYTEHGGLGPGSDTTVRLWSVDEPKQLNQFPSCGGSNVHSMAVCEKLNIIGIACYQQGMFCALDLLTGEPLWKISIPSEVMDGLIIPDSSESALFWTNSGTIYSLDLKTRQLEWQIRAHTDSIYEVDVSSDGKRLVSCSHDKFVRLWSTQSREMIFQTNCDSRYIKESVSINTCGTTILAADYSGCYKFDESTSWSLEKIFLDKDTGRLDFNSVRNQFMVTRNRDIKLYNCSTIDFHSRLDYAGRVRFPRNVNCLAISNSGNSVAVGCNSGAIYVSPLRSD